MLMYEGAQSFTMTTLQSHKLAIKKLRGSNEHSAGYRNYNVESVPVSETVTAWPPLIGALVTPPP